MLLIFRQLQIAQKEEAGIQLNSEEFDFMAVFGAYDEIEEVTANYTLKENLQPSSTSVEKVNTVNRKIKETNADLTTELDRYKNQEKCFEINQEKYDKLERCYQKSVYQEQCLTKMVNALHLSSAKTITTLNKEIANLNNQLSKEKSTVSFFQEEKKILKSDFKTREDEFLDKQIQLGNKIKELDNILSLYNGKVLLENHDPPVVYDLEEQLQLAQESRLKMKQLNKEIKLENYAKINHLLEEAAKFVRDFKTLASKADESLAKHKAL
ncbi:hypothetical protein Tco_1328666 [Tanacetum coccineum]